MFPDPSLQPRPRLNLPFILPPQRASSACLLSLIGSVPSPYCCPLVVLRAFHSICHPYGLLFPLFSSFLSLLRSSSGRYGFGACVRGFSSVRPVPRFLVYGSGVFISREGVVKYAERGPDLFLLWYPN
jgi:hypothetical protein